MTSRALLSSKSKNWETPWKFFNVLNAEFKFTLDPCATKENAKCKKFYTEKQNGLKKSWKGHRVFMNPPYSRNMEPWLEKASMGGAELVVCLLAARTDVKWFHKYVYGKAEIRFIKGRIHFSNSKTGSTFPSMLVIFRNCPDLV